MAEAPHQRPLTAREREVLKDIILMYVLSAEPVSSRSISKHGQLGLSSASIRNVMSDLEELGYLRQPHTSAGRVPTGAGYHLFAESLMGAQTVPARVRRYIDEHLREAPADADGLVAVTSHLLSELSQQVGIVVCPAIGETVLRAIEFVPLTGSRVLVVIVSESGFVDNKVIDTDKPLPREELVRSSNYLTESFAGLTLRQIRDRLLVAMAEERAKVDELLGSTLELARRSLDLAAGREVLVDGTSAVLAQPELADVLRVRRLIETFADKARLVEMLNACVRGQGVRVVIGEDSDLTSELDFSLVATRYGAGGRERGTLGIFGPSRMEYQRVIPLVHYLGETLSQMLTSTADS
ncbi:MAG TPA: heat-inducible transcriptional repressor HrcA [Thermoanaerobaculia bacterium]|nr:heat-inducible transcriptional repressor HrcA [Thermoanaerobaculia bacterium]